VTLDTRTAVTRWLMLPDTGDIDAKVAGMLARPAWMARAACRGEPLSTFFIERGDQYDRARVLCARCEVTSECLDYALADKEDVGWYAGTSGIERTSLRKKRRRRKVA
jgi:WhiB family redox-sensing transcriptional regulator